MKSNRSTTRTDWKGTNLLCRLYLYLLNFLFQFGNIIIVILLIYVFVVMVSLQIITTYLWVTLIQKLTMIVFTKLLLLLDKWRKSYYFLFLLYCSVHCNILGTVISSPTCNKFNFDLRHPWHLLIIHFFNLLFLFPILFSFPFNCTKQCESRFSSTLLVT